MQVLQCCYICQNLLNLSIYSSSLCSQSGNILGVKNTPPHLAPPLPASPESRVIKKQLIVADFFFVGLFKFVIECHFCLFLSLVTLIFYYSFFFTINIIIYYEYIEIYLLYFRFLTFCTSFFLLSLYYAIINIRYV